MEYQRDNSRNPFPDLKPTGVYKSGKYIIIGNRLIDSTEIVGVAPTKVKISKKWEYSVEIYFRNHERSMDIELDSWDDAVRLAQSIIYFITRR